MSAALVALALIIGRWWKIPAGKEMLFGSVRAFIQLIAVGYALNYIFDLKSPWLVLVVIMIMITVGAGAASGRSKKLAGSFPITFAAIAAGSLITMGIMLVLNIISLEARYVIPLSGMIISNAMNAAALTMNRIVSDIGSNRLRIETALSLGKTWREASRPFMQDSAIAGMTSILNFLKTVGIVALPGAMTGMILAGASPLEAVLLQIIVAYMLLSSVTISTVISLELTVRRFFTPSHQLKILK